MKHPKNEILSYIDSWIGDKTHQLKIATANNAGVTYDQETARIYEEGLIQGELNMLTDLKEHIEDAFRVDPFIDSRIGKMPLSDKLASLNPTDREKLIVSFIDKVISFESLFFSNVGVESDDPQYYYIKGRFDCIQNVYHQLYFMFDREDE